jgi:hypothetical protein
MTALAQASIDAIQAQVQEWFNANFEEFGLSYLGKAVPLTRESFAEYRYKYAYHGAESWVRGRYDIWDNQEIFLDLGQSYSYDNGAYALDLLHTLCKKMAKQYQVDLGLIHNGYGGRGCTILIGAMKNKVPKVVFKVADYKD